MTEKVVSAKPSRVLRCGASFEGYVCQRRWHMTGKHRHKNITELRGKGQRYELTWWGPAFGIPGRLSSQ